MTSLTDNSFINSLITNLQNNQRNNKRKYIENLIKDGFIVKERNVLKNTKKEIDIMLNFTKTYKNVVFIIYDKDIINKFSQFNNYIVEGDSCVVINYVGFLFTYINKLNKITNFKLHFRNIEECGVCYDDIVNKPKHTCDNCSFNLCDNCIDKIDKCPMCRKSYI